MAACPTFTDPTTSSLAVSIASSIWPRPVVTYTCLPSGDAITPIGRAISPVIFSVLIDRVTFRVDHVHGSAVFSRHIRARAVGKERRRARPRADLEHLDDLVARRVDDRDLVVFFRRDVHPLPVRARRDAFRFAAHLHVADDLVARDVDDARDARRPRSTRTPSIRRRSTKSARDRCRWSAPSSTFRAAISTTPMPSAVLSGGGSLLSSVPGGAIGDPLSATNSFVPSGLTLMPRGRLPSGIVATT